MGRTDISAFVVDFLLGGAAAVSKSATAPIERVKLLMQSQQEMLRSGRLQQPYTGIVDCFSKSVKTDGFLALWRGNFANILRYAPTQALNFGLKGQFKRIFVNPANSSYTREFATNIVSGGLAGSAALAVVYPLDFARTRLANDSGTKEVRQFNGIMDLYRKTIKSDGLVGVYRGFCVSVIGVFVYRGLYFGLYDSCKPMMGAWKDHWMGNFALGWVVTITAGMAYYPIDTVRRRMMMTSGEAVKYTNSRQALSHILQSGGTKALFHGAGANVIRSIAGALVLTGYDQMQAFLVRKHILN